MVNIKIEINLENLIRNNKVSTQDRVSKIPMIDASYNNEYLNQDKVWWKIYKKGETNWIRIEGRGESCMVCHDIVFRKSPGNMDILEDNETMCYHPKYGDVKYSDYPNNLYIQAEKLRQLENIGYVEGDDNFVELIN